MADLILYDGVCGLCHRLNRFILRRDPAGRFRFAALQGPLGAEVLRRHGRDPADLDTVYLVEDPGGPGERLHARAAAVLRVVGALGGAWPAARLLGLLPRRLLDLAYDRVAASRYRLFGRSEACILPPPAWRSRFLDGADDQGPAPPGAGAPPPARM